MTAAGSATTVEVGSTLAISAETDVGLDNDHYTLVWSVDDDSIGTISPDGEAETEDLVDGKFVTTLTGVAAGDVTITAELKSVSIVDGVRTLTSLDPAVTDTITITVPDRNRFATFKLLAADQGADVLAADVTGVIDTAARTVVLTVPVASQGTSFAVTALVASWTMAKSVTNYVAVGATTQVSGTTANDFTSPVTYRINIGTEGAVTVYYDWTITVDVES